MPRMGRPGKMSNEKANDFSGAMKRLFSNMEKWRTLMVVAIILAMASSIFSLISPNKLSSITDAITEGIAPKTEKLQEITKIITANFMNEEKTPAKIQEIMIANDVSNEDKQALQGFLMSMTESKLDTQIENSQTENIQETIANLPDVVMLTMFETIEIDGVTISSKDQLDTIKLLGAIEKNDTDSALSAFDKLPESVYELVKPQMNMDYIKGVAIFLLTLYIVGAIINYIQHFILSTVSNRFAQNLRSRISNKINKLPLRYFDLHEMGDILSRVTNDVDTIAQNLNNSLGSLVSSITLFIGCTIMMFYTNWTMAITAILASFIGFILMFLILGRSQKYFNERQVELGKLNGHIEEIYSGQMIVKVYNGEEEAKNEFTKLNKALYNSNQKSQFLSGLMPSLMNFIGNFGYVAVCIVGAILTINGHISFGVIVAFMMYVRLFTNPLSQIAQAMTGLQSSAAASERVFEFLDEKEMLEQKNIKTKIDPSKAKGEIEFKNLVFQYDNNDKPTIKNFSVKVKSGQKVAIVGPTGAGKTTMVNLLMKFYEITDGDILIDGISTKELTRENIHNLFTMVLQDTWLFDGTVRDNIKFNRKDVTDGQIWEALKVVGVDHFVKTLPGGLDSKIDDGESVSQGQKQLLTIARGMIENAPFLILDEATSNVDTRTEEIVQAAMDKLTVGKTSFIIAHRLSTIKNADVILVMNEGNIIEQGTHEELLAKNGFYAELYNSQFSSCVD